MPSRKGKWVARFLIVCILVSIGVWIAINLKPDPVSVEIGKVLRGDLVVTVNGSGKTRMRDKRTVFAPAFGELSHITLRAGDMVSAGQLIAQIEPPLSQPLDAISRAETAARLAAAKASLAEARRNVDRAQIASDLAKSEVKRIKGLVETEAAPYRSLEQATAEEKTRTADLDLSKLAVERARLEAAAVSVTLGDPTKKKTKGTPQLVQVIAPFMGVVLRVHTESAGPVQLGAPLIDIGDPDTLELAVELPTQAAVRAAVGAKVLVEGMGDEKVRTGKVRLIEPAAYTKITALGVEEQRVDVIVDLNEPPTVYGDGYAADARIEIHRSKNVLKVPSGAVFRNGDGFAVFKVTKNTAEQVAIKTIHRNADEVEITGLKEGDMVVIHPSDKVKHGTIVSIPHPSIPHPG